MKKAYWIAFFVVAIFSMIYEYFSFGVYSVPMLLAFTGPLFGGMLYSILLHCDRMLPRIPLELINAGIATLTAGMLCSGIIEIYGTTNRLTRYFWIGGIFFVFLGMGLITLLFYFKEDK
ncbi:MAG: hypothetical protein K6C69_00975 [Lachnospiraceae bacterium]|nr:hypothetical protein [Lachnospiraceae bacterium]